MSSEAPTGRIDSSPRKVGIPGDTFRCPPYSIVPTAAGPQVRFHVSTATKSIQNIETRHGTPYVGNHSAPATRAMGEARHENLFIVQRVSGLGNSTEWLHAPEIIFRWDKTVLQARLQRDEDEEQRNPWKGNYSRDLERSTSCPASVPQKRRVATWITTTECMLLLILLPSRHTPCWSLFINLATTSVRDVRLLPPGTSEALSSSQYLFPRAKRQAGTKWIPIFSDLNGLRPRPSLSLLKFPPKLPAP